MRHLNEFLVAAPISGENLCLKPAIGSYFAVDEGRLRIIVQVSI
jgi:hypothetical protein